MSGSAPQSIAEAQEILDIQMMEEESLVLFYTRLWIKVLQVFSGPEKYRNSIMRDLFMAKISKERLKTGLRVLNPKTHPEALQLALDLENRLKEDDMRVMIPNGPPRGTGASRGRARGFFRGHPCYPHAK